MPGRLTSSLLLFFCLVVFSFLLVSGGPRLIGHAGEIAEEPVRLNRVLLTAICTEPVQEVQSGYAQPRSMNAIKQDAVVVQHSELPQTSVCSDANGNVLFGRSYLHEVYRAFSLGDGFV